MGGAEIRLLGRLLVRGPDGTVVDPKRDGATKSLDLLRVLALAGRAGIAAEVLVDLLWPEVGRTRGLASLRTALCPLRRLLGGDRVVREGDIVRLDGVWVDVHAYRNLLDRLEENRPTGRRDVTLELLQRAEALYAGDLDVGATSCDWLRERRDELVRLRRTALLDAAAAAVQLGAHRLGLELAERAHAIEVTDESTRALMLARGGLGEMRSMIAAYEELRDHLADQYGVDPAPQTRALYLRLITDCADGGLDGGLDDLLVGRAHEVAEVHREVTDLLAGPAGNGVVLLVGPEGAGREAVARQVLRQLPAQAREDDLDCPAVSATLMPTLRRLDGERVDRLAGAAETLGQVLLVPVEEAPALTDLPERVVRVEVGAVGRAVFDELLHALLQARPSEALCTQLEVQTRGLPGLAARRVRRLLTERSVVWTPEGMAVTEGAPAASSATSSTFRAALAQLTPHALELLVLATTATRPFCPHRLIQAASRVDDRVLDDWRSAFEQLADLGIVEHSVEGCLVSDPRLRTDVLDWVRPAQLVRAQELVGAGLGPRRDEHGRTCVEWCWRVENPRSAMPAPRSVPDVPQGLPAQRWATSRTGLVT